MPDNTIIEVVPDISAIIIEELEEAEQTAETTTELRFSDVVNKPFNEMTSTEFNAFHFATALGYFAMAIIILAIGCSKGVFK